MKLAPVTVTFKSNYTNGPADVTQTIENGVETKLTENTFTRPGYTFVGWAKSADGTKRYDDKASVTLDANTELYAMWELVTSGTCGDNLTWNFDTTTGTLTISGEGAMTNYDYSLVTTDAGYAPWNVYAEQISDVVFDGDITSIGDGAFKDCANLTSIALPNGIVSVGQGAFWGCQDLISLNISDNVKEIGNYAFYGCAALTSVNVPYEITTIGISVFDGCSSITAIRIPNGVTSIGQNAFSDCAALTSIEIPNTVTSIGWGAFDACSSLTMVKFQENSQLTSIDHSAFYGCTKLTSIEIPNTVTSIGWSVFNGCSALTTVMFPNGLTSIGVVCFYGCSALTSIEIPGSVTTIGANSFYGCSALTSITIPCDFDKAVFASSGITIDGDGYVVTSGATGTFSYTHTYDQEKAEQTYLKTPATCTAKAVYYKSCSCGAFDNGNTAQTFESGTAIGHKDENKDHICDNNCGKSDIGAHADIDKDHDCDYGCAVAIGTCEDKNKDHTCDYGCGKSYGTHEDGVDGTHNCDYCGKPMEGDLLVHTYGTDWKSDKDNHWHECTCGDKKDTAAHTPKIVNAKEATTSEKGYTGDTVCEICGYEITKGEDIPVKVTPNKPNDDKVTSPETGDNSNMFLWIALLFASGFGIVGATVLSKKRKLNR